MLAEGTFVLGRSSKCHFVVKHDVISRRHAEITVTKDHVDVVDLGSRNGTFIGKDRVSQGAIVIGQRVRFGTISFLLAAAKTESSEVDSEVETAPGSELPAALGLELSKAQCRVLNLLMQGLPEKKIAAQLHLSSTTIHNHTQAIYRAFKVHSRAELLVCILGTKNA
jgi:pSer/pThr/pTyr-binding forkhead associated (FHA) protein